MRWLSLLRKKCTICGEKCDDIRDVTAAGLIKEWCCNCTVKKIGIVTYCNRCL